MEGVAEGDEAGADVAQAVDGALLALDGVGGEGELLAGGIDFQPPVMEQVFDLTDNLDVVGREVAGAFVVAPGAELIELRFPVSDGRRRQTEQLAHFAYFVEFFRQVHNESVIISP